MQSTLGESLQQLNPKSIVSTPNEQRKRSNLNGSLELNFRINFSRRTSTDVVLILLTFEPTYIYVCCLLGMTVLFFQVSMSSRSDS